MRSIRKKKKSNLYFSQTTLYPSKLVNQITFRLHRWKFNYFHRAFSKKGKKEKEREREEKKRGWNIFTRYTTVSNRWIKGVTRNTFSLSRRAWSTAFVRPRNFSVSFGLPPNGCILCQLNSLLRHAGNCLAGNGRRVTTIVLRHGHPENRFNWFRGTAGN